MNFGICLQLSVSPFLNFFVFFSFFLLLCSSCSSVSNYFSKHFPFFVRNQPGQPWITSLLLVSLSSASLDAPFLALILSLDEVPVALRVCPSLGRDFSSVFLRFPLYPCFFQLLKPFISPIPSARSHTQLWFSVNSAGCKINFCY